MASMHSASTVLDDIIDELRLKYDSSVGLLDGDAVREIPNLNTLQNLSKLLAKLSTSLAASENSDSDLLIEVNQKIEDVQSSAQPEESEPIELVEEDTSEAESVLKRERAEEVSSEDSEAPKAKKPKHVTGEETEEAVEVAEPVKEEEEKEEEAEEEEKAEEEEELEEAQEEGEEEEDEEEMEEKESPVKAESEAGAEVKLGEENERHIDSQPTGDLASQDVDEKQGGEAGEAENDSEIEDTEAGEPEQKAEPAEAEVEAETADSTAAIERAEPEATEKAIEEEEEAEEEEEKEKEKEKEDDEKDGIEETEGAAPTPPVQVGSFTQNNDTRLKNPKSEFVSSQTLSQAAITELGLFSEDHNGLETQGDAYLKKKYGVASYPANDLKRMLPGEIPRHDFSKTKPPANQVQFSTYQSYIESYFRPFASDDVAFVSDKYVIPPGLEKGYDPLAHPYLIPKLGNFYTEAWTDEDAALGSKLSSPAFQRPPLEAYRPKGSTEDLVDEKMLTEDVSCGPLSSRLLSAILNVHEVKAKDEDEDDNVSETGRSETFAGGLGDDMFGDESVSQLNMAEALKAAPADTDFLSMEERLKQELNYIGIFSNADAADAKPKKGSIIDSDDWIVNREDDEICAELRQLQGELKGAVVRNRKRKRALAPLVAEHLAFQEFATILDELDKQVDQAYTKRLKARSKRKKLAGEGANAAQQQTANSGLKSLLEKRSRWIGNIGKLFDAPEVMKRIPDASVFANQEQSEDEDGDGEVDVVNEAAA